MTVYLSLISVLAAIVIGNRLVASDRKAGILPLYGARPIERSAFAKGKLMALGLSVGVLAAIAGVVGFVTFLLLPNVQVSAQQWLQFGGFFGLSSVYSFCSGRLLWAARPSPDRKAWGC
ncbi:hypothetical protein [Pseudorhodobacter sp.]|uniref:hypothetical protein n=1 Tax=Pseudorhodobacter sp. TaxID=1934400 RepID=UPI002648C8B7|nr:hypothetical protein [Pseudorhodobacter sp.]MDN5786809.1 hypothetical protein [Pseudorhodobacter sp.]